MLSLAGIVVSGYVTGAVQPKINQTNLNRIKFVIPDTSTLERFNDAVLPLFQFKDMLERWNEALVGIRDLLLPRLVSGKIDVSRLEIDIPNNNQL